MLRQWLLIPLILLFLLFNCFFLLFKKVMTDWNIDQEVMILANLLYFVLGLIIYFMIKRSLSDKNPHVFIRSVMGAMLIKMLIVVTAVVIYVVAAGKDYSKNAVFLSLFLYLVYLVVETRILTRLNRKPNA